MNISILDHGAGNILSVRRAFEECYTNVKIISSPEEIINAERLILPGVGSFAKGMEGLLKKNLIEPIQLHVYKNKPLLGICLGMQLLFETSQENGNHDGLKIIEGNVVRLPIKSQNNLKLKVPRVCWAELKIIKKNNPLLKGINNNDAIYLVHSYYPKILNVKNLLAVSDFGDYEIPTIVQKNLAFGCQFHPEKSGLIGLKIIKNFLKI